MAERLGAPLSTYKNWELGISFVPADIIWRLANAKVSLKYLFFGTGPIIEGETVNATRPASRAGRAADVAKVAGS